MVEISSYVINRAVPSHDRRRLHTTSLLQTWGQITLNQVNYNPIFPTPAKLGMKKRVLSLKVDINNPADWLLWPKVQLSNNGTSIAIAIMELAYKSIVGMPTNMPVNVADLRFNQVFSEEYTSLEQNGTDPQVYARRVFGNMFELVANLGGSDGQVNFDGGDAIKIRNDATAGALGDVPFYSHIDDPGHQNSIPYTIRSPTLMGRIMAIRYSNPTSGWVVRYHAATNKFSNAWVDDQAAIQLDGTAEFSNNQTGIYVANLNVQAAEMKKLLLINKPDGELNTYLAATPITLNWEAVGQ